MERPTVHIQAPTRLHFGLLSFGGTGRQYGGVGVMIKCPSLKMTITPSSRFETGGPLTVRISENVRRWSEVQRMPELPACRVEVLTAPPQHVGLGTGTQLAYSVAAGLNAFTRHNDLSPLDLARIMGRGHRSAVGTYGFVLGGLIVEAGKLSTESLSPLDEHIELPDNWRFVLVRWKHREGLSGVDERRTFATLPPVDPAVRDQLREEIHARMIPSIHAEDCVAFGESVYRYGRTAGNCFSQIQGGPYNGPQLSAMVEQIRGFGVNGVGQSSWGPTIFAIVPNQPAAEQLRKQLFLRNSREELDVTITASENCGATITCENATLDQRRSTTDKT